jgi:hypothetical protein
MDGNQVKPLTEEMVERIISELDSTSVNESSEKFGSWPMRIKNIVKHLMRSTKKMMMAR